MAASSGEARTGCRIPQMMTQGQPTTPGLEPSSRHLLNPPVPGPLRPHALGRGLKEAGAGQSARGRSWLFFSPGGGSRKEESDQCKGLKRKKLTAPGSWRKREAHVAGADRERGRGTCVGQGTGDEGMRGEDLKPGNADES